MIQVCLTFWINMPRMHTWNLQKIKNSVAGEPYIEGFDGQVYRVSEKEFIGMRLNKNKDMPIEGDILEFKTPEKKQGNFKWAYNIKEV